MPLSRRAGRERTYSARPGASAGRTPARCMPTSRSMRTPIDNPLSPSALSRRSAPRRSSTTVVREGEASRRRTSLAILAGVATGPVTWMPLRPAFTSASASETLAAQAPTAPTSICRRARAEHLWVLAWGRIALPARETTSCIFRRFRSRMSVSSTRQGVSRSMELPDRGHHADLFRFYHIMIRGPAALPPAGESL